MFSRKNRRNREKTLGKQAVRQAASWVTEPLESRVMLTVVLTPSLFVVNNGNGTIGTYNATTGATINAHLITGLNGPVGIAISGSDMYITEGDGTVAEYTTLGGLVNANLVTGLNNPEDIVVSGGNLFVVDEGNEVVGEYNATTGATVNANLITFSGSADVYGLGILGGDLFVSDQGNDVVGEYTTGGVPVHAALINGATQNLTQPEGIVSDGTNLYITDLTNATVSEYNATTGATVHAPLISSGFSAPYGIALVGTDLYVPDQNNNTISEYTTAGVKVTAPLVSGLHSPTDIAEASVAVGAPVVTTNPSSQAVPVGDAAVFTAAVSGTPTPTVQWQLSTNGGTTFNDISGATSTTYSFTTTTGENGYEYQAVFTNSQGTATTTAATLTVLTAPSVTTNPTNQTVGAGGTATFTAAASGTLTPTVQWEISTDGGSTFNNISGATSTTYSFTATIGQTGDKFEAVFTNGLGSATTTAATLTVLVGPTITKNPVNQVVAVGNTVVFTAAATGTPAPTVQWQLSTNGGSTFSNISGATSTTYSFTAAAGENGNKYQAVFTNSQGSVTSGFASLTFPAPAVSGFVYNDRHDLGVRTHRDGGMSGIVVNIQAMEHGRPKVHGLNETITTDAIGEYNFENLVAGVTYQISEYVPRGYEITEPSTAVYTVNISAGVNLTGQDFGNYHHKGRTR